MIVSISALKILLLFLWLLSLRLFSSHDALLTFFIVMFGCFFVLPSVFVNIEVLKTDYMLRSMYLTDIQVFTMLNCLIVYLASLIFFFQMHGKQIVVKPKRAMEEFKMSNLELIILVGIFMVIMEFYIRKIVAIQNEGYVAYHLGLISVKKGIGFVLIELLFQAKLYILMARKSVLAFVLFFLYSLAIVLTGMRMPFIVNSLLAYILYLNLKGNGGIGFKRLLKYLLIGFGIVPPLLLVSNRFRQGALQNISLLDEVQRSYEELFVILGVTLDTLKGAIVMRNNGDVSISLFSRVTSTFGSVLNKMSSGSQLSMSEKLDFKSFGSVLANYFNPSVYKEGLTIGSSFIAETYFSFGYVGCVCAAMLHIHLTSRMKRLNLLNTGNVFIWFSFGYWFL
ncbi:O-antigen polysaccharide polymerase Wzy family protein, partial [Schleiferiaceae bacterium]|nr:O-antigen polysaccharide polymerase Wzy family protein [Schleiferiaceae bacterium]